MAKPPGQQGRKFRTSNKTSWRCWQVCVPIPGAAQSYAKLLLFVPVELECTFCKNEGEEEGDAIVFQTT